MTSRFLLALGLCGPALLAAASARAVDGPGRATAAARIAAASTPAAPPPPERAPVRAERAVSPSRSRPNLLLVTFDTLRRDHVSCYGHDVLTTPTVDRLAAEGMLFTDAQGVVPTTGPSHATILTGLYPQVHGAFRNGVRLPPGPPTLAEILKAQGYKTGAVVSGWTLRETQCGLGRGFDSYDDSGLDERYNVVNLMRRADAVTDAAVRFLDTTTAVPGQPWFLFVHYFDPHEPYDLPFEIELRPNPAASNAPRAEKFTQKLAAYDAEIAFADRELGRLLDDIRRRGEIDDTLVVFTADHGQSFGDNGYGGPEGAHGREVYQSQVAVPLVLWQPGRVAAGRSPLPVSHIDVLPTIAGLLGVPEKALPATLPGAALARVAVDPEAAPPWGRARRTRHGLAFRGAVGNKWNIFRFMQNRNVEQAEPLCAYVLTDDGRKVVVDFARRGKVEVYDLRTDPGETRNLAGEAIPVELARERGAEVFAWYDHTRSAELSTTAPSPEDLEKLRTLGYVE